MPFWLKIGRDCLFFPLAMPYLRRTTLSVWEPGARRWRRGHWGSNPSDLSVEDRRADLGLGARSAYVASIWASIDRQPDVEADHCQRCGEFTGAGARAATGAVNQTDATIPTGLFAVRAII